MKGLQCCLLWPLFFLASPTLAQQPELPSAERVLDGLRSAHPRLLATADDFARLKSRCEQGARAGQWLRQLRGGAERLINTPPLEYRIPDGKRLLSVSRAAKDRLLLLGLVYRLTGEKRFSERAWRELDTVTHFKDWNPSHFLDTAEMTFAVSIGYDWLYDAWTDEQRRQLRGAIVALGLEPGRPIYRKRSGWARSVHNWNQVCNGGMGVGALAIADQEPELAAEVLHAAVQSLPLAMREFRPDGGWGEGPGYWRYATEYNVYFLAALRTALGTDFGLANMPGFAVTGDFPIHFIGPTGLTFNYADAHDGWRGAPQLFWLATAFDQPAYASAQLPFASSRPSTLDLLWGAAWLSQDLPEENPPTDRHFSGVSVVTMRSAWRDPRAIFVGFKGGDNRVNHGHLDLGSFVLDAAGVRWAIDLGPDDYNIPGYFGKQRWTYYRNMTAGHNTLLINGKNQSTSATAAMLRFAADQRLAAAVADLSRAYPDAQRVWRGLAFLERRHLLVRDEIDADQPVDVVWRMHTHAEVKVDGRQAIMKDGDRRLYAWILSPLDARFGVAEASTEPPQRPLKNVRCLTAIPPGPTRQLQFVILISTHKDGLESPQLHSLGPLNQWPGEAVARESAASRNKP